MAETVSPAASLWRTWVRPSSVKAGGRPSVFPSALARANPDWVRSFSHDDPHVLPEEYSLRKTWGSSQDASGSRIGSLRVWIKAPKPDGRFRSPSMTYGRPGRRLQDRQNRPKDIHEPQLVELPPVAPFSDLISMGWVVLKVEK